MTRRARIWLAVGAVLLAGIAAWAWWKHRDTAERRALAAEIQEEVRVRRASFWPPPPEVSDAENAAPLWTAALDALDSTAVTTHLWESMDKSTWDGTPQSVRNFVEGNAKALALADEAASRPGSRFPAAAPSYDSRRGDLRMLLEARGRLGLVRGDAGAALRSARALKRLGHATPGSAEHEQAPFLWPAFVWSHEEAALALLVRIAEAPQAPAQEEALGLAVEPWSFRKAQIGFLHGLRISSDEYCVALLTDDSEFMERLGLVPAPEPRLSSLKRRLREMFSGEAREQREPSLPTSAGTSEVRRLRAENDRVLAVALRWDVESLAPGGPLDAELADPEPASEKSTPVIPPSGPARGVRRAFANEALLEVVRAALALRAFEAREGRPARSLEELVPSLLPAVPIDPGDGKPVKFEVRPGGGAVWSVLSEGKWEETREREGRPRLGIEWGGSK